MLKRIPVLAATPVTLAGMAVSLVPVAASASVTPARPDVYPGDWCGNQAPPCVVSASRDGVAITENDPAWEPGP